MVRYQPLSTDLMRARPFDVPFALVTSTSCPTKYGGTQCSPLSVTVFPVVNVLTVRVPNEGSSLVPALPTAPLSIVSAPSVEPGALMKIEPAPDGRPAFVVFVLRVVSALPPDVAS